MCKTPNSPPPELLGCARRRRHRPLRRPRGVPTGPPRSPGLNGGLSSPWGPAVRRQTSPEPRPCLCIGVRGRKETNPTGGARPSATQAADPRCVSGGGLHLEPFPRKGGVFRGIRRRRRHLFPQPDDWARPSGAVELNSAQSAILSFLFIIPAVLK